MDPTTDLGRTEQRQQTLPPPPGGAHGEHHAPPPTGDRPPLRRSREDRVIAGVCGGLGRYLGIDPVLLRVGVVLLAIFGGSGIIAYIIAAIVIPDTDAAEGAEPAARRLDSQDTATIVGAGLVGIGALSLVNRLLPGLGELFWPLALVAIGAIVLLTAMKR